MNSPYIQLHIGVGAFHRAHQAVYMQRLNASGNTDWHIVAGNMRDDDAETIAALIEQKGAYTVETIDSQGHSEYERVEAIKQIVPYDAELAGLCAVAADPQTQIISFTVTEPGYYFDGNNELDERIAAVHSDLHNNTHQTIYGCMRKLLDHRRANNAGPVTLMTCDNLRSNGERFLTGFTNFLKAREAIDLQTTDLLAWLTDNVRAPNAMVDRITPRPSAEVRQRVLAATGIDDGAAIMAEPYIQWVIEDNFAAARPAWETVGVEMVDEVMPYEEAKIRLLNATHSCFAWAGHLRGYDFIHEDCADEVIMQMAHDYVTKAAIPALEHSYDELSVDLPAYRDKVLDRFSNPNIIDGNHRVSMDAYAKIPSMMLPTIRTCIETGEGLEEVVMLPALFLAFLMGIADDPAAAGHVDQAMPAGKAAELAAAEDTLVAFSNEVILFEDLAGHPALLSALQAAWARIADEFNIV